MDLFAPCRSCLQCLPFFHLSPSARPAAAAPSPSRHSPDAAKATSIDPAQTSENLPSSTAAAPVVQEQDLCPPITVEEKTEDVKCDALHNFKDEYSTVTESEVLPISGIVITPPVEDYALHNFKDEYSTVTESEVLPISGIVIAPPVSSPPTGTFLPEDDEDNKATTLPDLPMQVPFINDITFSSSGFMPLQSPITPAPFGAGYPVGQYPPYDQIYQDQHLAHAHSYHRPDNSQHGDEDSCPGAQHEYSNSHREQDHSHHGHDHSLHGHVNSHDGHIPQHNHVHTASDYEVPHLGTPLDDSQVIHELHKDASQHQSHDCTSVDDVGKNITGHTSFDGDHHDKIDDISPIPPLEASQSTLELDLEVTVGGENSAAGHTNGASALLEAYHSEPVVRWGDPHDDDDEARNELVGHSGSHPPARRRRRDHFRDHLKGIKQQVKQGGHHLKEEGSKHMQTIIENMNKQAQQVEQSGSFFMVPRN